MTIDELRKKMRKINKAKNILYNKYFKEHSISWNFYKEYIKTVERIECSLLEKYHKEHYGKYDKVYTGLPYYNALSENTIIRITLDTVYDCRGFCYLCTDRTYSEGFGKIMLY